MKLVEHDYEMVSTYDESDEDKRTVKVWENPSRSQPEVQSLLSNLGRGDYLRGGLMNTGDFYLCDSHHDDLYNLLKKYRLVKTPYFELFVWKDETISVALAQSDEAVIKDYNKPNDIGMDTQSYVREVTKKFKAKNSNWVLKWSIYSEGVPIKLLYQENKMDKQLLSEILDGLYKIHIDSIKSNEGDMIYQVYAVTKSNQPFTPKEILVGNNGGAFGLEDLKKWLTINKNRILVASAPTNIEEFMKELEGEVEYQ